jgi:hypothetical protein
MQIAALSISGYRGFTTAQEVVLARPTGAVGSGLTVLVGPNNAGKSSIIEALSFIRQAGEQVEFVEGQKNASMNGRVQVTYKTDIGHLELATDGGSFAQWRGIDTKHDPTIYVLEPRRRLESTFQLAENWDRNKYLRNLPISLDASLVARVSTSDFGG